MLNGFDAVVIGAGAAGLLCAALAGQRGVKVLLLDHAAKLAEKIRISGGGRCNFTNRDAGPANFVSANPRLLPLGAGPLHAARLHRAGRAPPHRLAREAQRASCSATTRARRSSRCCCASATPAACSAGSRAAVDGGAPRRRRLRARHRRAARSRAAQLVVATGGLSIPKIGASDFGYRLARQFGHRIVETAPGAGAADLRRDRGQPFAALAGVSLPVRIAAGEGRAQGRFVEDLLFTHRGLSGPAVLQISTLLATRRAPIADRPARPALDLARALRRGQGGVAPPARQRARRSPAAAPRRGLAGAHRHGGDRPLAECATATSPRSAPACSAGADARPAPRATARPRSRPAASTPAS